MTRSISITVHPSELGAEYLTVSDAMRQVLDIIEVLEKSEDAETEGRQIVWRLTEAHTNSPPFTITAEAFPSEPVISIALQAEHVTQRFAKGFQELLDGRASEWLDSDIAPSLKRIMKRNLNGVGRTEIAIEGEPTLDVLPARATGAVLAIERHVIDEKTAAADYRRTEYGAVEVSVIGLTQWNNKRALLTLERLSGDKVTCVLTDDLADRLGLVHNWSEAWGAGDHFIISGALRYGQDGTLKRIDADDAKELPWTDVSISDLADIDLLQGRSVSDHLALIRGGDVG